MANLTLCSRRKIIKLKLETTKGTGATVDLYVLAFDAMTNTAGEWIQRQPGSKFLGNIAGMPGDLAGQMTFRVEMRGDGVAAVFDDGLEACMQACGYKLAGAVYSPTSDISAQQCITLQLYEDGIMKKLIGAMGNVSISGVFGQQMFADFTFSGVWQAVTDVALPTASYSSTIPPTLKSTTFTCPAGTTPFVANVTVDLQAVVTAVEDISKAGGISHYVITDRDPIITIDSQADLVATNDVYGAWLAGTEIAFSLLVGGTANNKFTIAAPKFQYREIAGGDRDGKLLHEATGQCNASSGDDEITITCS